MCNRPAASGPCAHLVGGIRRDDQQRKADLVAAQAEALQNWMMRPTDSVRMPSRKRAAIAIEKEGHEEQHRSLKASGNHNYRGFANFRDSTASRSWFCTLRYAVAEPRNLMGGPRRKSQPGERKTSNHITGYISPAGRFYTSRVAIAVA